MTLIGNAQQFGTRKRSVLSCLFGFACWSGLIASSNASLLWVAQPATGDIVTFHSRTGVEINRFAPPIPIYPDDWRVGLSMAEAGETLLFMVGDPYPPDKLPDGLYRSDRASLFRLDPWTGAIKSRETDYYHSFGPDGLSYQNDGVSDLIFYSQANPLPTIHRQTGYSGDEIVHLTDYTRVGSRGGLGGDGNGREFGGFFNWIDFPRKVRSDVYIAEYDPATGRFLNTFASPSQDVEGLAFDGEFLYVATASGMLHTLNPNSGIPARQPFSLPGGVGGFGLAVAVDEPHSGIFIALGLVGVVLMWRRKLMTEIQTQKSSTSPLRAHQYPAIPPRSALFGFDRNPMYATSTIPVSLSKNVP